MEWNGMNELMSEVKWNEMKWMNEQTNEWTNERMNEGRN